MKIAEFDPSTAVFRLTAFWALSECGLGGILHALKVPFSGLFLCGISVSILTLILFYCKVNRAIFFQSLATVLIIKFTLSPHSSLSSYFSVGFQGFVGYVIYRLFSFNYITILTTVLIAYFETATHKIVTLTIFGGMTFWKSVSAFIDKLISETFGIANSHGLQMALVFYYAIYVSAAFIISIWLYSFLQKIKLLKFVPISLTSLEEVKFEKTQKSNFKVILILLIFLIPSCYLLYVGDSSSLFHYLLRTMLLLCVWYFMINPLLQYFVNSFMSQKAVQHKSRIEELKLFFPVLKGILNYTWKNSQHKKGLNRIYYFITYLIINILSYK